MTGSVARSDLPQERRREDAESGDSLQTVTRFRPLRLDL